MKDLKNKINFETDKKIIKAALRKAIKENSSLSAKEKSSLLEEINNNEKVSLSLYKYLLNQLESNQNIVTAINDNFKKAAITNNLKIIKFILTTKTSYISDSLLKESLNLLLTNISDFDYRIYGVTFGRSLDIEKRKPAAIEILKRLNDIPKFENKFLQDFINDCLSEINTLELRSKKLKTG